MTMISAHPLYTIVPLMRCMRAHATSLLACACVRVRAIFVSVLNLLQHSAAAMNQQHDTARNHNCVCTEQQRNV
jgi:hypothetical protein